MERFNKQPFSEEQFVGTGKVREHERHPNPHVTIFERPEGIYEEVSFLQEPIQAYKDDLIQIGSALVAKQNKLSDLERMEASHKVVSTDSALHILDEALAGKIKMLREEIGRLDILRTVTQQRIGVLTRHDLLEQRAIDGALTDIEQ